VTLGVAVLGCCLALAFSLVASKTHEALLGTYAVWGLWLLAAPMIGEINRATGWSWAVPPRTADPFALAFAPCWWPGRVGPGDYLRFLAATGTLSALLAAASVLRLRSTGDRGRVPGAGRRGRGRRLDLARRLPGPSLDFNPVFWREWHRNRPSRWASAVGVLYVALASVFSLVAVVGGGGQVVPAWVNGLQVSIGLLLLSVSASTSLAEERVRGSLDVLLASPMSTREIVLGKWLGTFRLVPPLAILPGLVLLCGPDRGDRVPVFVLTTVFILSSGAAIVGLGLAMATWCPRLGRAVGLTVTLYVLVAVGWMFLVMITVRGPAVGEGPMMGSPFFWVGEMTFEFYEGRRVNRGIGWGYYAWGIFWIVAYAFAAAALLAATLLTFNRCLGRVESGLAEFGPRAPEGKGAKPLGPVELIEVT
jgi:ABC-type transport system involved in multi-copper enzyme maturation permease subunit